MATIYDMANNVYLASITVNGRQVRARPSDAIVLCLKTGAPLFVTEEVLNTWGISIPDEEP